MTKLEQRLAELNQWRQAAFMRERELQQELNELVIRIHQHNGAIAAIEEVIKGLEPEA